MQHDVVPFVAIAIMLAIAVFYAVRMRSSWKQVKADIAGLEGSLTAATSANHDVLSANSIAGSRQAGNSLWTEWEATLVESTKRGTVYRSIDAEMVFSAERVAPAFAKYRHFIASPGIFTGLGVLGTFFGLAMGFQGLQLGGGSADVDTIIAGAGNLVQAAAVAFYASIAGVLLSLIANVAEKLLEQKVLDLVAGFQLKVDKDYPLLTPEQSLLEISDSERQTTEALQELHEKIGSRLQEALEQQSTTMRQALSTSISEALFPAVNRLADVTTEQSAQVFEQLVEKFAASFTDLGAQQRAAMDASAERLQQTIDGLGSRVAAVTEEMRAQSAELAARQQTVLDALGQVSAALTSSTENLDSTATSLIAISERFEAAGTALTADLDTATTTLERVFAKLEEQARASEELTTHTSALAAQMTADSQAMLQSTTTMGTQLEKFSDIQSTFAADLEKNSSALAASLSGQVEKMSADVSKWLGNYSADVERQIESRMEKWNSVSQDYASSMLEIAQALNDTIDELPARSAQPVEAAS